MSEKEEFEITSDEAKKLSEALKKEEFCKLLAEYANEISDPENRKRYEEEIIQLENERGYNVKFLNPTPGFVVKTKFKDGGKKVFINIATNPEIKAATPGPFEILPSGQAGSKWSIPYSLVVGREGLDSSKQKCTIYDCMFNPKTLDQAVANPKFKEIVIITALDGIENEFNVNLERNSLKYPKSNYKGAPSASVIRKSNEKEKEEFDKKVKSDPIQQLLSNKPIEQSKPAARDPTLPQHTMKYRGYFDMQDYTLDPQEHKGKPKEIVITVSLPKLDTIKNLKLDVEEKEVKIFHNSPRYKLDIPLSYRVRVKEAQARFVRDVRELELVLPIIHTSPVTLPPREIPETIPSDTNIEETQALGIEQTGVEPAVPLKLSENALQTTNYDSDDITSDDNLETESRAEVVRDIQASDAALNEEECDAIKKLASELPPLEFRQTFKQFYFSFTVAGIIEETIATLFRSNEVELSFETSSLRFQIDVRFPFECSINGSTSQCRASEKGLVLKINKLGGGNRMWDTFRIGCREGKLVEKKFLTESNILREMEEFGDPWSEEDACPPLSIRVNKEDAPLTIELNMKATEHMTTADNDSVVEQQEAKPVEKPNSSHCAPDGINIPDISDSIEESLSPVDTEDKPDSKEKKLLATLSNDLIYELND